MAIKKDSIVSFTDKKLKTGKTYYYKVRAYKTSGKTKTYGAYGDIKSAKAKKITVQQSGLIRAAFAYPCGSVASQQGV